MVKRLFWKLGYYESTYFTQTPPPVYVDQKVSPEGVWKRIFGNFYWQVG